MEWHRGERGKIALLGSQGEKAAPSPQPPQVPSIVRCIHPERVLAFQQQTQFLWDAYFSSVDKIVHTTLEVSPPGPPSPAPEVTARVLRASFGQIIKDRLLPHRSHSRFLWNTLPGGLLALPDFSTHLGDFPFYYLQHGRTPPAPSEHDKLSSCHTSRPSSPLFFQAPAPLRSSQLSFGWSHQQASPPSPSSGSSKLSLDPNTVPRLEELSPAPLSAPYRDVERMGQGPEGWEGHEWV